MSLDELLHEIDGLSLKEQRELRARLDFLSATSAPSASEDERELYDAIAEELRERGVPTPPLSVYARTGKHYKRFAEAAAGFSAFINEVVAPERKPLKQRAYRLVIRSLADRLEAVGAPLKVGSLVGLVPNAPRELGRMFPGYAQAGLLKQVLGRA